MSCNWECQSWSGTRALGCSMLPSRGNIKADESCYCFVFAVRGVNKMRGFKGQRKSAVWMVNRYVPALSKFLIGVTNTFQRCDLWVCERPLLHVHEHWTEGDWEAALRDILNTQQKSNRRSHNFQTNMCAVGEHSPALHWQALDIC